MNNNKTLAFCGIIGGLLMMLANILANTGTGMTGEIPDPGWLLLPPLLCGITEILALLGTVGYLAGWISLLRMIQKTCNRKLLHLAMVSAFGIVGMPLFHENISCIEPIVYQVLSQGQSVNLYSAFNSIVIHIFLPIDILIILAFYCQLFALILGIMSGQIVIKKGLIFFTPVTGLILSVILWITLPGAIKGIGLGIRNLSEGLMYLIPLYYWKEVYIEV